MLIGYENETAPVRFDANAGIGQFWLYTDRTLAHSWELQRARQDNCVAGLFELSWSWGNIGITELPESCCATGGLSDDAVEIIPKSQPI